MTRDRASEVISLAAIALLILASFLMADNLRILGQNVAGNGARMERAIHGIDAIVKTCMRPCVKRTVQRRGLLK